MKTFSQAGSLTLGGNVSVAAGPVGRNAEAAGAASLRSIAGIFSYSKTKGLFAGVSLEGSVIIERKDANAKLYGRPISARELLSGSERSPAQAYPLLSILNSRVFAGMGASGAAARNDAMYNDIPVYSEDRDHVVWGNNTGNAFGEGQRRDGGNGHAHDEFGRPKRASTWQDDTYDQPRGFSQNSRANTVVDTKAEPSPTFGAKKVAPGRPAAPKPNFVSKPSSMKKNEAVALYKFVGEQPGDLSFEKGDIITVLKKTDNNNDWWWVSLQAQMHVTRFTDAYGRTGMVGTKHGIFPSNYVKMNE